MNKTLIYIFALLLISSSVLANNESEIYDFTCMITSGNSESSEVKGHLIKGVNKTCSKGSGCYKLYMIFDNDEISKYSYDLTLDKRGPGEVFLGRYEFYTIEQEEDLKYARVFFNVYLLETSSFKIYKSDAIDTPLKDSKLVLNKELSCERTER